MFEILNRQLDTLFERLRQQPVFQWATVTSVSPLQIRYDGATDPVAGSPSSLVAGLQVGDRVWCQRIHRRDIILGKGGGHQHPYAMAAGRVLITPSAANTPTAVTVTFPIGRFTQRPNVFTSIDSAVPGSTVTGVGSTETNAVSTEILVTRTNTTNTWVTWQAVQMTSTSADG